MDCAIVLMTNLCLLSLNLVWIISLIRYSLIRTLCSHNGCKHAFRLIWTPSRFFHDVLWCLWHCRYLHVTARIRNLLHLHLMGSIKDLLPSHCSIGSSLICWKPIFHIRVLWVLVILLGLSSHLSFLLSRLARFIIWISLHGIDLVLGPRSSTSAAFYFHR